MPPPPLREYMVAVTYLVRKWNQSSAISLDDLYFKIKYSLRRDQTAAREKQSAASVCVCVCVDVQVVYRYCEMPLEINIV